ncbi:MAG: adenylate kinase [Candidatus Omnitrophota bacterium]|jgi:adenylate kinase|nr:MAG: adenylate kinase [Candidatus Omnitrophota bacterium]
MDNSITNQPLAFSMFGPPGCGKGTQAALIQERLGYQHASTGDMFREAIARKDANALEAQDIMQRGDLVPDKLIRDMLFQFLKGIMEKEPDLPGFILDGFPRTLSQAELLLGLLQELNLRFPGVIYLDVPEELVVERLKKRGAGGEQRADDNEEVILERMRIYKEKTYPLRDYFDRHELLIKVDGVGTIDEIYDRLEPLIHSWR